MHDQDEPDGELNEEQRAIVASLSPEQIARVDACLLSHANTKQRKVAMLVGKTMMDKTVTIPGLPDLFYRDRVKALVAAEKLLAFGNLDYMRYSEVRLAG